MLVTVVQRALNQNLDLDAALARVRQARAAASGAGAELLPTADLGASATLSTRAFAASSVPSLQAPRASGEAATTVQDVVEKQVFADCTDRGTTAAVGGNASFPIWPAGEATLRKRSLAA